MTLQRRVVWLLVTSLGAAGAGCGGAPSCEEVAEHVASLPPSGAMKVAPEEVYLRNCRLEESKNADLRVCVMKATSLVEAKACELEAALKQLEAEGGLPGVGDAGASPR